MAEIFDGLNAHQRFQPLKTNHDFFISRRHLLCFCALFCSVLATAQAQLSPNATSNATRDYRYITWQDLEFGIEATRDTDGQWRNYVAKNGHGHSTTVQGAVDMVPDNNQDRVKIVIFPGTYKFGFLFITTVLVLCVFATLKNSFVVVILVCSERVHIKSHQHYISFIGNPNYPTVITNNTEASDRDPQDPSREIGTFRTATVEVEGD
ncbi:hypothetical protein Syun_026215 [Stephania yunnanensis]|uniref:Uncharacterized protein n=1 Tax=Stephania yunnanensis TaxID=152371 RepID=A0AAP0EVR2_9MAGN